ncbi:MAG: cardiolipin synthase [Cytophagales bacterium]|nr:cardiolipin synthase [Cytophagales bacterium]
MLSDYFSSESIYFFVTLLLITYLLMTFVTVIFVLLENRSPFKTISWIVILIFVPFLGFLLYSVFGEGIRKHIKFSKKRKKDALRLSYLRKKQLALMNQGALIDDEQVKKKRDLIHLSLNLENSLLFKKNNITILQDGEHTYSEIFKELEKAEDHIHIEYYVFDEGDIANRFLEIFEKKTQQGVKIRFVFDGVGSFWLSKDYKRKLKNAGVDFRTFQPVRFPRPLRDINYRNHRKIIVIDGKVGFLGGINISDKYLKPDPALGFWRDTHLKIEGESVHGLQHVFIGDWSFLDKKFKNHLSRFFPKMKLENLKSCYTQIVSSGPDTFFQTIKDIFFSAIATAQKNIFICTPYFMPDESVLMALKTASLSGKKVKIILPQRSDTKLVGWCTRSYIQELLEHKIEVHFYQPGFIHSKVILIDSLFCSVGTANMDYRSFSENLEVNAIIYDQKTYRTLESQFRQDLSDSVQVSLEKWLTRSSGEKLSESIARLFAPLF